MISPEVLGPVFVTRVNLVAAKTQDHLWFGREGDTLP